MTPQGKNATAVEKALALAIENKLSAPSTADHPERTPDATLRNPDAGKAKAPSRKQGLETGKARRAPLLQAKRNETRESEPPRDSQTNKKSAMREPFTLKGERTENFSADLDRASLTPNPKRSAPLSDTPSNVGLSAQGKTPEPKRFGDRPLNERPQGARSEPKFSEPADVSNEQSLLTPAALRPPRAPRVIAWALSSAWLAANGLIAFLAYGDALLSSADVAGMPAQLLLALHLFITAMPIAFIFAAASLFARASRLETTTRQLTHLASRFAQPETHVEEQLARVGLLARRELERVGEGIDDAAMRASELSERARSDIDTINLRFNDSQAEIHKVVNDLKHHYGAMNQSAESLRDAFLDVGQKICADAQRIEGQIKRKSADISEAMEAQAQKNLTALADGSDALIRRLENRLSMSDQTLKERLNTVNETIGGRQEDILTIVDDFKTQYDAMKVHAATLQKTFGDLGLTLSEQAAHMERQIATRSDEIADALEARFVRSLKGFKDGVQDSVSGIEQVLLSANADLSAAFKTSEETLAKRSETARNHLIEKLEASHEIADKTFNAEFGKFETMLGDGINKLNKAVNARHRELETYLGNAKESFDALLRQRSALIAKTTQDSAETFDANLVQIAEHISDAIATKEESFMEAGQKLQARFAQDAETMTNRLIGAIQEKSNGLNMRLESAKDELSLAVETRASMLTNQLDGHLDKTLKQWETSLSGHLETLGHAHDNANAQWKLMALNLDQNFVQRVDEVSSQLETVIATLNQSLEEQCKRLNDEISDTSKRLDHALCNSHELVGRALEEIQSNLSVGLVEQIEAKIHKALGGVETLSLRFEKRIDDSADKLGDVLLKGVDRFSLHADGIADELDVRLTAFDALFDKRYHGASNNLILSVQNISESIEKQVEKLETIAGGNLESALEKLQQRLLDLGTEIDARVGIIAEKITRQASEASGGLENQVLESVALLKKQSTQINDGLVKQSANFAHLMRESSEDLHSSIAQRSAEVVKAFSDSGNDLLTSIDKRSDDAVHKISNVSVALRESLSGLLTHTDEVVQSVDTNRRKLGDVAKTAQGVMLDVNQQLQERAQELQERSEASADASKRSAEALAEQILSLREVSNTLLGNVGHLAKQFDGHSQSLGTSAEKLEEANLRVEGRLRDQQEIVRKVTDQLVVRIEEVEGLLRDSLVLVGEVASTSEKRVGDFASTLRTSFEEAASEAEVKIERLVTFATWRGREAFESVSDVCEKFNAALETMQSLASDRGEKTLGEVRASCDEMRTGIESSFGEVNRAVHDIASNLRRSTETIHEDLTSTCNDIQDVVQSLPKAVRTGSDGIHRAIDAQLKAIAELSDSANHVVGAISRGQRQTPLRDDGSIPSPFSDGRLDELHGSQRETKRSSGAESRLSGDGFVDRSSKASVFDSPSPFGKVTDASRRSEGAFVSATKGSSPEQRPSLPDPSLLPSNLADAVDDRAINDLWIRFRRGERDLFSRSLYRSGGQAVFDGVRDRLGRDRHFRESVERYLHDFDLYLDQLSRSEASNDSIHAVLVSQLGKVFTLLSHAAGRKV